MKRVFIAIPAGNNEALKKNLHDLQKRLREEKIKYVAPENLHLTLHFFGDMEEKDIHRLNRLLTAHLNGLNHFELDLYGAGVFPGIRKPRVLWFGLTPTEALDTLAEAVEKVLLEGGFGLPGKPFSAHLTIGRIKWIEDRNRFIRLLEDYKDKTITRLHVEEVYLYESILKPEGPVYKELFRYELRD